MLHSMQNPSQKSISFIRQYARCYHVEPSLPKGLSGMSLN
jgi:hypothetical protein